MPPIRTCVACREKADPDALVRMALHPEGHAIIDFRGKLPGRGAWVHPGCLSMLEAKPGLLKRSFKTNIPKGDWVDAYRTSLQRALEDGLSQAGAAGALVGGNHMFMEALRADQVIGLLLSADIAPASEKKLCAAAKERVTVTRVHLSTVELGAQVGKGARAALGVRSSRAASHLLRQLRRMRALG